MTTAQFQCVPSPLQGPLHGTEDKLYQGLQRLRVGHPE